MKKLVVSLLIVFFAVSSVYADSTKLRQAIRYYKSGNYIGAMQALQELTAVDPGNALAHYYLGMAYVQIGSSDKASAEYDSVISLAPNSQLATFAQTGKTNLNPTPETPVTDPFPVDNGVKLMKDFYSDQAFKKLQENKINNVIKNLNDNKEVNPDLYEQIKDFTPGNKKSSNQTAPSQEEIAQAMQTLSKAGINTAASYNPYMQNMQMNPEMMQMNMLMSSMGGGNGNMQQSNPMSMMPMLMMMQNGQGNSKIDPETIQSMVTSMMMPDMMNIYQNNNNN